MGVRTSLEEVARRAAAGGTHPRVRSWSIEQIHAARQAGRSVKGDRARAEILLQTVQRTKTWVPDPVAAEYIPGAHLLACNVDDKDGPCLKGDDCDGLVVLFVACCLSVGLHAMVVGHAYNSARNIQHVLGAVRINGTWLYADPSYDFPLGKCEPFSRERLLSVPNVKVICDSNQCLIGGGTDINPEHDGFVAEGLFIGVNGIEWLGQSTDSIYAGAEASAQKEAEAQIDSGELDGKAIAQAAGAGAAAAGCAAVGAGLASPICAAIGSEIGGWLADVFKSESLFQNRLVRGLTTILQVRSLRRDLAGEEWSNDQAKAYLDRLKAPCNVLLKKIMEGKGVTQTPTEQELVPVAKCLLKQRAKMLAEFSAVGAAKAAEKAIPSDRRRLTSPKTSKTSSPVVVLGGAAAIGGFLWWLLA